ncbi:MAG TPA: PAS domain S-box protein [Chloroflexi bacterium]|nr:PAS domain S-box protein [Chloroflexota bacterium]
MSEQLIQREFDLLMQYSKNGIITFRAVHDGEFTCHRVNPTMLGLLKVASQEEVVGKTFETVFASHLSSMQPLFTELCGKKTVKETYVSLGDVLYKVFGASTWEVEGIKSILFSFVERWRYSPSFYGNQALMNAMQDAIFVFDYVKEGEFRLNFLNEEHQRSTGLNLERDAGKTPQELVGEEDGARIAANYQRCIDENITMQYEEYTVLPAGAKSWQTKIAPVLGDGKPKQIIGASRDITALKNANEALNALYTEYEAIFNESNIPMSVEDVDEEKMDFRITRLNKCFEDTFQMPTDVYRGQSVLDFLEEPWASEMYEVRKKVVLEKKPHSLQHEIKLNNKLYTSLTTLAPVIRNGRVVNIVGSAKDISEIKRYQDVLKLEGQMLAQRLANRTEALQASAEQQEEFFTSVTQEFRAPITSILGLIEVAKQTVTEHEPLYPYLNGMRDETEHLMGFVDAILDATRVGQEREELRIRRFDVKRAVAKVVETVTEKHPAFEGRIHFEDHLPMVDIWQDEDHFIKVFSAIVEQAVLDLPGEGEFTFKGEYLAKTKELCFSCLTEFNQEHRINEEASVYNAAINQSPRVGSYIDIALTQLRAKKMGAWFRSTREGTQNKAEFFVPLLER